MGHGLSRRQSRAAASRRVVCRRLRIGRGFVLPAARIDRPASPRTAVQAAEQKNGTQKSRCDYHLCRSHRGRIHLHTARPDPNRVTGNDVFPAGTRRREIRTLDRPLEHLARRPEQDLVHIHFIRLAHRENDSLSE